MEDDGHLTQMAFPLEPIVYYAGGQNITPDGMAFFPIWIQHQLAWTALSDLKILTTRQSDEVAWRHVHRALESVLRMFQVWVCKQVMGIANTNSTVNKWDKGVNPHCPSCHQAVETTEHILMCNEAGRVYIFLQAVDLLDKWLGGMDTDPPLLWECILRSVRGEDIGK